MSLHMDRKRKPYGRESGKDTFTLLLGGKVLLLGCDLINRSIDGSSMYTSLVADSRGRKNGWFGYIICNPDCSQSNTSQEMRETMVQCNNIEHIQKVNTVKL